MSGTSWNSSKTNVATVQTGLVRGVRAGSTSVTAYYSNFVPAYAQIPCGGPDPCPVGGGASGSSPGTVAGVSCSPSSVTRGSSVTCTATGPSGSTFSNWKFSDGTNTVNGSGTSSTWSGIMVTSGTVSVTVTGNGASSTPTAQIAVTNRSNFAFTAVPATKRTNPYVVGNCSISVPTSPAAGNAVGFSCLDQYFNEQSAQISDHGPNQGFWYVASASNTASLPTAFNFIIAGYLDDSGSQFSQMQCGNYNAATNTGFISYSQLLSNTYEHESGTIRGHYIQYKSTQDNPSNNVGTAVEPEIGGPGLTQSQFDAQVFSVAQSKGGAIASATSFEDCNHDVRLDTSCVFRGFISWPAYTSCQ